jgi:VWFA-related protein
LASFLLRLFISKGVGMIQSAPRKYLRPLLLCLPLLLVAAVIAQERKSPSEQTDEVLRISSNLVQTDVMVFDQQGHFVDGLKPDQFELRVDGKPQSISFFERITAGSSDEDTQIMAARGGGNSSVVRPASQTDEALVRPLDRGRVIFFYLDDLHLASDSIKRIREGLARFVENEMGQNDQVDIHTASGQLGVLQQLTSDKVVLQTALKRLQPRPFNVTDNDRTPMSEHQALNIERGDRAVLDYFVEQLAKESRLTLQRRSARTTQPSRINQSDNRLEQAVKARARAILEQAAAVTQSTLTSLENLVRASAPIPGRKLLFLISDGFYINEQTSDSLHRLSRIADAATRSGTVIYSLEARGLISGVTPASERAPYDPTARVQIIDTGAVTAGQQPLQMIAANTGGRALLNTNDLAPGLDQALKETSAYYLLAWRPEAVEQSNGKFHQVEVKVKGRNDLTVRVTSGFLSEAPPPARKADASKYVKEKAEDSDLLTAIRALYPKRELPTALSVGYTNATNADLMLTASVQVDASVLDMSAERGGQKSNVDVVGVLINDEGKTVADFEQRLTVDPSLMTTAQQRRIVYSHQLRIAPGLYQMRIATRDNKSGRTGSAAQWIEIPDISRGVFSLGSLFVGEMTADIKTSGQQALISVNRRFSRTSRLLFQTYVYNAARGANTSDVALQVQVFRDDQPVITVPLRKLPTDGITDLARISYEDDFSLDKLPPGRYALQVTAIDRTAKASASQRLSFEIE